MKLRIHLLVSVCVLASACASGTKRLDRLDQAVEQPGQLEALCKDGSSGACVLLGQDFPVAQKQVSIMQSVTSDTMARFVILAPKKESFGYFVRSGKTIRRMAHNRVWRAHSPMATDLAEIFDLNPHETYELIVVDGKGQAWEKRQFRTLDLKKKRPRIAVISCLDDSLRDVYPGMWKQLMGEKPDVIFMIGDNVYANHLPNAKVVTSGDQIWDRYVDTRSALDFFREKTLVPVFATWDDHDFGANDSDRTFQFKDAARDVFFAFYAQTSPASEFSRGPGVASMWRAYGMQFVFTDDRTFRTPDRLDLPDQTHFGVDQEEWLNANLQSSKQPVLLISGDQFFGAYHPFESYEGNHPKSFAAQLKNWRKAKVPIVFVSGDRHLTEILNVGKEVLGYPTFELTSSPLHAKIFADALRRSPSPNQMVGFAGKYNYMLLDILEARPNLLKLNVTSYAQSRELLYQKTLTVKR